MIQSLFSSFMLYLCLPSSIFVYHVFLFVTWFQTLQIILGDITVVNEYMDFRSGIKSRLS